MEERGVDTVVALGNIASTSLLGSSEGVSKLRVGLGKPSPYMDQVRVIPTFHPAACLRNPDFFPSLVTDVGKVNRSPTPWPAPSYVVYDDVPNSIAVLEELIKHPTPKIVIDIETDVDKEDAYDHPNNYALLCIGICYAKGKVVVIERNALLDKGVLDALRRLLRRKKLIAQNGKYDLKGLYPKVGKLKLWFDTMLASYALDERGGIHGLGIQGVEILGTPDWKHDLDKYSPKTLGYGVIPPDVLDKYNANDCAVTWDLEEYYTPLLEEPIENWPYPQLPVKNLRDVHDFLVEGSNALMIPELNGIGIDIKYNTELMHSYLDVLAPLEEQMIELLHDPEWGNFNPRSPQQVKRVLKEVFDITIPMKRNQKGQMAESTDIDTLNTLQERYESGQIEYEFLRVLKEHRKETKLYGTYVKGIRKRLYHGRVYTSFLLHGTTSGRLASRNPNLQNIPRLSKIRGQFVVTKPENVFVSVDYSQAELRVLTWLAQEPYFRDIFNDPTRDLFNELTPVLYGEAALLLPPAQRKEKRIRVKGYVYGLAYGREAGSIADEFDIPVEEAAEGMSAFFGVIPNIVQYQSGVEKRIRDGQDLMTPFGRHRRFHLLTAENIKKVVKEGLSFEPQSTSSDLCLQALMWSQPELAGIGHVRNIVHDNIMVECHEDRAEEVGQLLNRNMIKSAELIVGDYVRFATDTSIGRTWGELS
jgi:DNA polymerase-1